MIELIPTLSPSALNFITFDLRLPITLRTRASARLDSLTNASPSLAAQMKSQRDAWSKNKNVATSPARSESTAAKHTQTVTATDRLVHSAHKQHNGYINDRTQAKQLAEFEWNAGADSEWRKRWNGRTTNYVEARANELMGFAGLPDGWKP
jgi:hypothetical protein